MTTGSSTGRTPGCACATSATGSRAGTRPGTSGRGLKPLQGLCICGGVAFEVTEPFSVTSQCHCEFCKRISGGYGTVSGRASTDAIRVLEGEGLLRSYTPDGGSAKTFCSTCGSN